MIAGLTLAVASIAALGSILGPLISYRATVRALRARSADAAAERQQVSVDRAVDMALDQDPATAEVGVGMLRYFARSGELTPEQATAVYAALDTVVSDAQHLADPAELDAGDDNGSEER